VSSASALRAAGQATAIHTPSMEQPLPRRDRLSLPHVPLHIIQRGNNRQACFFANDDYRFYLIWTGWESTHTTPATAFTRIC